MDIFRKRSGIKPMVEAAVRRGAKAVWMPIGTVYNEAALLAQEEGPEVVMGICIKPTHERLMGST